MNDKKARPMCKKSKSDDLQRSEEIVETHEAADKTPTEEDDDVIILDEDYEPLLEGYLPDAYFVEETSRFLTA